VTIGAAILMIAVGAILKWAVTAHVSWIDIQTAGTIIFVVGLVSLVLAVIYTFWRPRRSSGPGY
jgi:heme/copper-type cytochrome/quinol oxidase subunit 2